MDRRVGIAAAAATIGAGGGILAATHGSALGGALAAVACGVSGATAVVNAQRAETAERNAGHAELSLAVAEHHVKAANAAANAPRHADSVYDAETGLLDHRVFDVTFDRKIAAARRHLRPLSLVLIDLAPGLPADALDRATMLKAWGDLVVDTLRDCDIPCRVGDTTFGIICEDTPESGAVWVAERLQIAAATRSVSSPFLAAVSTYPNHGLQANEVLRRGWEAMGRARRAGRGFDRFSAVELPQTEP